MVELLEVMVNNLKRGLCSGHIFLKIFIVSTGTASQLGTITGEYFFQKNH